MHAFHDGRFDGIFPEFAASDVRVEMLAKELVAVEPRRVSDPESYILRTRQAFLK